MSFVRTLRASLVVALFLWPWLGRVPLNSATSAIMPVSRALPSPGFPQQVAFRAAQVVSASDVKYPLDTTADGIVVFNVSLDSRGQITNTTVLNDVPPLTESAQSSLRLWKFKPASRNGVPEASQIMIAFAFRHAVKLWNPPPFTAVFPSKERENYVPPGIFAATYADYPASTIAAGATVVQVEVNANSRIGQMKVVRGMSGGFVPLALEAARKWQFQSAVLDGTPVPSEVAIAFVFSSRALNPF